MVNLGELNEIFGYHEDGTPAYRSKDTTNTDLLVRNNYLERQLAKAQRNVEEKKVLTEIEDVGEVVMRLSEKYRALNKTDNNWMLGACPKII